MRRVVILLAYTPGPSHVCHRARIRRFRNWTTSYLLKTLRVQSVVGNTYWLRLLFNGIALVGVLGKCPVRATGQRVWLPYKEFRPPPCPASPLPVLHPARTSRRPPPTPSFLLVSPHSAGHQQAGPTTC